MSNTTPKTWPTTSLLDIPVDCPPDQHSVMTALLNHIHQPNGTWQIVTMNAEMAYAASLNPRLLSLLQNADMVLPDGIGVVWALGRMGIRVPRLPGVELVSALLERASKNEIKVGIIGSSPETLQALEASLTQRFGQVPLCFSQHGYFKPEQEAEIIAAAAAAHPDVLFVALGVPRQEEWIAQHREQLKVPVLIGVGGSFDVLSGRLERAPVWMQKAHLEWFFRLLQQPSRWRRMLALPQFVLKVWRS